MLEFKIHSPLSFLELRVNHNLNLCSKQVSFTLPLIPHQNFFFLLLTWFLLHPEHNSSRLSHFVQSGFFEQSTLCPPILLHKYIFVLSKNSATITVSSFHSPLSMQDSSCSKDHFHRLSICLLPNLLYSSSVWKNYHTLYQSAFWSAKPLLQPLQASCLSFSHTITGIMHVFSLTA